MSPRPRRIGIVGHIGRAKVRHEVARLVTSLRRRGCEVRVEAELGRLTNLPALPLPELAGWCQLMISLGGDGTVLIAGRALAGQKASLLAVNLGGLGFLAAAEAAQLDEAIDHVFAGRWPVAPRRVVEARVRHGRGGRARPAAIAMNDAVVRSGVSFAAIHLRVTALGYDLGHLVADGLIAASASGSTAYSLSAGGPIVEPGHDALVVTPACAHSLGSRSLILGHGSIVTARVISPGPALLVLDGQNPVHLEKNDEVEIRLSRKLVRVHENPDRPFLRALQSKLGWQGSERRSL